MCVRSSALDQFTIRSVKNGASETTISLTINLSYDYTNRFFRNCTLGDLQLFRGPAVGVTRSLFYPVRWRYSDVLFPCSFSLSVFFWNTVHETSNCVAFPLFAAILVPTVVLDVCTLVFRLLGIFFTLVYRAWACFDMRSCSFAKNPLHKKLMEIIREAADKNSYSKDIVQKLRNVAKKICSGGQIEVHQKLAERTCNYYAYPGAHPTVLRSENLLDNQRTPKSKIAVTASA